MLKYKSCKFLSKFVDKNFEPSLKPLKFEQIFTKKTRFLDKLTLAACIAKKFAKNKESI